METAGDVLLPSEAEAYVENLEPFDLKDIGSSRFEILTFMILFVSPVVN